jgi:hypothetical protein
MPAENDPFWNGIDKLSNPYELDRAAMAFSMMGMQGQAEAMSKRAQQIRDTGLLPGGKKIPGTMGKQDIEALQPARQEFQKKKTDFESKYGDVRGALDSLSQIYAHYHGGATAEARNELVRWASEFGLANPEQATDFQTAAKMARRMTFEFISSTGMTRAPGMELRSMMTAEPEPGKTPGALRNLIAQSYAALDREHALYSAVGNPQDTGAAINEWNKRYGDTAYKDYLARERNRMPLFAGVTQSDLAAYGEKLAPDGKSIIPTPVQGLPADVQWSPSRKIWWSGKTGRGYDMEGNPA